VSRGFSCLAWHPQGQQIAAGDNGELLIWSKLREVEIRSQIRKISNYYCVSWRSTQSTILTCPSTGQFRMDRHENDYTNDFLPVLWYLRCWYIIQSMLVRYGQRTGTAASANQFLGIDWATSTAASPAPELSTRVRWCPCSDDCMFGWNSYVKFHWTRVNYAVQRFGCDCAGYVYCTSTTR